MPRPLRVAALAASLVTLPVPASARQDQPSAFDRAWGLARWYDDSSNPVVQTVLFTGRFQHEFARVSDDGAEHEEWNVRRMRLGLRSDFLRSLRLHVEADLNPQEREPFFTKLTDAYLEWSPSSDVAVTVGKHGVAFTVDGSTSSKELLTIDRSNLANNLWFTDEYVPGVSASVARSRWDWTVGAFSAGDEDRGFGDFSGGVFTLASLGYDLSGATGAEQTRIQASWVWQEPDVDNSFTRPLQHVGSLGVFLEDDRFGLRADLTGGRGYLGQSDLWGASLMPYVDVGDAFQVVLRLTRISSSDPNGVRFARYESELLGGRGDRYREAYLGGSWFVYGHKLKVQAGLQAADMRDEAADGGVYSGVGLTAGLRLSW